MPQGVSVRRLAPVTPNDQRRGNVKIRALLFQPSNDGCRRGHSFTKRGDIGDSGDNPCLPGFERGDTGGDKMRFRLLALSQVIAQCFIKVENGAPRRSGRRWSATDDQSTRPTAWWHDGCSYGQSGGRCDLTLEH